MNQNLAVNSLDGNYDDTQFQPPIDSFGMTNFSDLSGSMGGMIDQNFIDQKIMQNIQKYISGFMSQ